MQIRIFINLTTLCNLYIFAYYVNFVILILQLPKFNTSI